MTAASRAALVRIARAASMQAGTAGDRRVAALRCRLAGAPSRGFRLAELSAIPAWQCQAREDQARLARRVALVSMAPVVAMSIDGEWLGTLAQQAGEDEIDRVVAHAGEAPSAGDRVDGALDARGFAMLRVTLPPHARRLSDWAPDDGYRPEPQIAQDCLALAERLA